MVWFQKQPMVLKTPNYQIFGCTCLYFLAHPLQTKQKKPVSFLLDALEKW